MTEDVRGQSGDHREHFRTACRLIQLADNGGPHFVVAGLGDVGAVGSREQLCAVQRREVTDLVVSL